MQNNHISIDKNTTTLKKEKQKLDANILFMLGKKNNSFQRMVLMSGIAQGSANGPKKIFGRENVNWQGPQKAGRGNENKGDSLSVVNDFSHAQDDTHEYKENLHQAFIDDLGGEEVKKSIVANAVLSEMHSSGVAYTKESMDDLQKKYNDYYDDFINTDEGAEALENDLTSALDSNHSIVSGYDSEKDEFSTNKENINLLSSEGAFDNTHNKFKDFVSTKENGKIDKDSSIEDMLRYAHEDMLRYAQENSEQIEKEIEQARLQDAQDRGYDSIEDYEWDLEYAQDSYAEGRGFDVVQRESVSNVVEDYIENNGENINEEEKEQVRQHYNRLFNDFYEEGFNSETVLAAALSSNSSFEVVDVRDGDLEVDEEQEEQWAKSFEFDYVKDKFSSYVKDHPYQG